MESGAKSPITTHVLDTARGVPGVGIPVRLEWKPANAWVLLSEGTTNHDGRIVDLLPPDHRLLPGTYRLIFSTERYLSTGNVTPAFYGEITVAFRVGDTANNAPPAPYHIPLLLSPFGYSTYRGS